MKILPDLLNEIVSTLQTSALCRNVHIVETIPFLDTQFAIKLRAELGSNNFLQVRVYVNSEHVDYAYQLFRDETPILRWDNKEHFPEIASYPHHFHAPDGHVEFSTLNGDVTHDLAIVLDYLATYNAPP